MVNKVKKAEFCEIFIYIHNNWFFARPCIESVLNRTKNVEYHITLIDDASNPHITKKIKEYENKNPAIISIFRNENKLGHIKSLNKAIKNNKSEFIAIISTKTCVTDNWLKKMLKFFNHESNVGICVPLANNTNITSINIPPSIDMLKMNSLIEHIHIPTYPNIPFADSHLFVFRKDLIKNIGYFSEKSSKFEIAVKNFSSNVKNKGYKIVCVDNVFVFHSHTKKLREKPVKTPNIIQHSKLFREINNKIPALIKKRKVFQKIKIVLKSRHGTKKPLNTPISSNINIYKSKLNLKINRILNDKFQKKYLKPKKKIGKETKLNFLCILPTLNPYGGVISVVNMLNHLIEMGHNCILISLSPCKNHPHIFYGEPIYVPNWKDIPGKFAGYHDVFIATSWDTVDIVVELKKKSKYGETYYFVQDLEETFYKGDYEKKEAIRATYKQISTKFVKTDYLYQKLKNLTDNVYKIRPGMNLDLFYPHNLVENKEPVVLGMVRCGHYHRGYDLVLETLNKVYHKKPYIKIVLFGSDELNKLTTGFNFTNLGRVKPEDLPEIYSDADIFLEMSRHHGFGRTGVEAMACGNACVLSNSGGINEYALNNENAFIVPVEDTNAASEKICFLIDNPHRRNELKLNGLKTVHNFADRNAAKDFLDIVYKTHPLFEG
jgi:glycosyltransferase involved in cell wall biosynthesis